MVMLSTLGIGLPHPATAATHVELLLRKSTAEEHIEQLFGSNVGCESKENKQVCKMHEKIICHTQSQGNFTFKTSGVIMVGMSLARVGRLHSLLVGTVEVILLALFHVRENSDGISDSCIMDDILLNYLNSSEALRHRL